MLDATFVKEHLTASSMGGEKGGQGRLIGRTKDGMNMILHAVTDAIGRPISFFMTAGQVSDTTGAAVLLDGLPKAQWLLGDRGYDADWFRQVASGQVAAERAITLTNFKCEIDQGNWIIKIGDP